MLIIFLYVWLELVRVIRIISSILLPSYSLTLRLVIISFRPAWLARVLLCYKRTQSSGNDDADEGRKTPFDTLMVVVCQSSSPKLPMAVDITVSWQLPVVLAMSPGLRKLGELLWLGCRPPIFAFSEIINYTISNEVV